MEKSPFILIENASILIPILEKRLPRSANVFNMAKLSPLFQEEMKFYHLFHSLNEGSWILATYKREDFGVEISISTPSDPEWTPKIEDAFVNHAPFDWNKPYCFTMLDQALSLEFYKISARVKGNLTLTMPSTFNYITREDALKLQIRVPPGFEVKSLDPESGREFLFKNWKYSIGATRDYIGKLVQRVPSGGVYSQNEKGLHSGIVLCGNGLMGFLHTEESHRGQGLGTAAIQFLMRELASQGLIPCASAEIRNEPARAFQKRSGLDTLYLADYVALYCTGD